MSRINEANLPADIQLFPELKDGLVSGGSPLVNGGSSHLSTKVVTVCALRGKAEFSN
jgi:hypothetical protein